jgi:hypothetical protein
MVKGWLTTFNHEPITMQIDSGLSGYGYSPRPQIIDRKAEETAPRETETRQRSASAMTGSSTLLSSSLANALWMVGDGGRETADSDRVPILAAPAPSVAHVEDVYSEF